MAKLTRYDSADWHYDEEFVTTGLPDQHSAHHILYFQRWLHEHDALTDDFWAEVVNEGAPRVFPEDFRPWGDIAFMDYMVKPEWRPFVDAYYQNAYQADYVATLPGELPSMYHIPFTDEEFAKLETVLDDRYFEWLEKQDSWGNSTMPAKWRRYPRTSSVLSTLLFIAAVVLVVLLLKVVMRMFLGGLEQGIEGTVYQVPVMILLLVAAGWGLWKLLLKKP